MPFSTFLELDEKNYQNMYFVFVKFKLYRSAIPEYIYDEEPIYVVKIRGENVAWIYNAEQIQPYLEIDQG